MRLGTAAGRREAGALSFGEAIAWTVVGVATLVKWCALAIVFVVVAHLAATSCSAAGKWPGPHAVDVLDVKDADTVAVRFRDGPCGKGPCPGAEVSIRVRGIDAPEVHLCRESGGLKTGRGKSQSCAQCDAELVAGRQAAAFAARLLAGSAVRVRDIGPDAYNGRYVGVIEVLSGGGWRVYADLLQEKQLAVRYDPEADKSFVKQKPWCARDDPGQGAAGSAKGMP